MITPYSVGGIKKAFRVEIIRNGKIVHRKFFEFRKYPSQIEALKDAKRYEKEKQITYNQPKHGGIFAPDGRIWGLCLRRERNNIPYMVAQARYNGKKITIYRSLATNKWGTAFEDLVKELLIHYRIRLTHELALEIESKKKLYDPSRKSNWKPRPRYTRPVWYH